MSRRAPRPYRRHVVRAKRLRSVQCLDDGHEECPHFSDLEVGNLLRRRSSTVEAYVVCTCTCHDGCPLTGQGSVAPAVWEERCTCPGAGPVRARREQAAERRREVDEVLTGIRHEGRLSVDEVAHRLRAIHLRHGEAPPPGLTGWAQLVSAGTARPGTRTPRLLWLGVRVVADTVRWAWLPAGDAAEGGRDGARVFFRVAATLAVVSALLTGAAARASGGRRAGVGVGAALAWLATLGITSVGTAVLQLVRVAGAHSDVPADS